MEEVWPRYKLSELAYALQIDYDPNNINEQTIIGKLNTLKYKAVILTHSALTIFLLK